VLTDRRIGQPEAYLPAFLSHLGGNAVAKVRTFSILTKYFSKKMTLKHHFLSCDGFLLEFLREFATFSLSLQMA
ncbi:MAG: hypothetical protein II061_08315, partial [Bacteroidaceae bacterium]|nr:hypothetical protein [Bacteroidaceae bacterium]